MRVSQAARALQAAPRVMRDAKTSTRSYKKERAAAQAALLSAHTSNEPVSIRQNIDNVVYWLRAYVDNGSMPHKAMSIIVTALERIKTTCHLQYTSVIDTYATLWREAAANCMRINRVYIDSELRRRIPDQIRTLDVLRELSF